MLILLLALIAGILIMANFEAFKSLLLILLLLTMWAAAIVIGLGCLILFLLFVARAFNLI